MGCYVLWYGILTDLLSRGLKVVHVYSTYITVGTYVKQVWCCVSAYVMGFGIGHEAFIVPTYFCYRLHT